jgi:hypothetical protein
VIIVSNSETVLQEKENSHENQSIYVGCRFCCRERSRPATDPSGRREGHDER